MSTDQRASSSTTEGHASIPAAPEPQEAAGYAGLTPELIQAAIQNLSLQAELSRAVATRIMNIETMVRQIAEWVYNLNEATPRGGRFAVFQGDNLALTRVLNRLLMYVDTSDISVSPQLLMNGCWEMGLTKVFCSLLQPGMTVVDVGANVGYYTLVAATAVGQQGRVYSFEPDPRNFAILQKNLHVNSLAGRVQAYQLAALDTRKKVELKTIACFLGDHSLFDRHAGHPSVQRVTVEAAPLDELIRGEVHLMKIDAEGSEPLIFNGMRQILDRSPDLNMVMEFNVSLLQLSGDPSAFLRQLCDFGFAIASITEEGVLEPFDADRVLATPISNLLLTRR
jgi:FkbM family methyltransferase